LIQTPILYFGALGVMFSIDAQLTLLVMLPFYDFLPYAFLRLSLLLNRTPEAFPPYQALKLLKIDTAMVRIPDASHGITRRPSNLIAKVAHILTWFEKYRTKRD
ncbi:MAG: hypothetical protein IH793_08495, partial [Acidobacteria bacterium]|nr:hypothetical protein [Acidobacteriota bacterium]